jgi:hypothetical protein
VVIRTTSTKVRISTRMSLGFLDFIISLIIILLNGNIFFYRYHMTKPPPPSGSEHTFTTRKWGSPKGRVSNNCYAYAVNNYKTDRAWKAQPGERVGRTNTPQTYVNCGSLPSLVKADNPNKVYMVKAGEKCKPSYYKIMMFVATCKNTNYLCQGDFHFYKQHNKTEYKVKRGDTHESIANFFKVPVIRVKRAAVRLTPGRVVVFKADFFSHKRGWGGDPIVTGATGKLITDPRTTSRKYSGLNYNKYCSSFCVKNTGIKVGHTYTKVRK